MSTRATLALGFTALLLAACGNSTQDRALSGGGIGAGVGALGGALIGHPVEGALLGGAAGAGTGALTNSNQVDRGKPVWK
jgi:osmotically inducible lipoprotein OsmB